LPELTPADEISVRVHPVMIEKSQLHLHRCAIPSTQYLLKQNLLVHSCFTDVVQVDSQPHLQCSGDIVAVSRHVALNSIGQRESDYADRDIAPIETTKTKFLIRLEVG
jgi:homoserine dehydrogenase